MTRNDLFRKCLVLFTGVLLATGAMKAQSTTQGAIAGTVEDVTGAVIPGANVTVHNDGTNAEVKLTSDASGYFKLPLAEPGTYTLKINATGFGEYVAGKVIVQVGRLTEVMPKLTTGSAETTVQVSADATVLNFESPDAASELTRDAIDNIPVNNRRWSALALSTPGVVADASGFGLVSVRGMSTLLNNVMIDGADDNQAYFSEERGRTREAYSTSANAVNEFAVNTGVYAAQFGRAAGGVINSVTRSGSNTLHGELLFEDLDRGLGAYVPGLVSPTGQPLKPRDARKIYGGSVGGAILKDKLFWFYTYDQQTHINPGVGKVRTYGASDGSTVNSFLEQPDASVTSCNTTTGATVSTGVHSTLDGLVCTLAARLNLGSYGAGVTYYNAGVQSLLTDLGRVPRVGYQEINTPKLDYQITPKERVSLLYHRLRWDAPGDVQTASTANYSVDAFGTDFVKLDYGVAKLSSQIGSKISNELLFQYSRELDDEGQQPYSAYTLANLVSPGTNGSGFVNGPGGTIPFINLNQSNYGFFLGSPYYSYRQALPDERKLQIEDTLFYTFGNHSIRFGGDYLRNVDLIKQEPYYFGYYSYSNTANYLTDLATKGTSGKCNSTGAAGTTSTSGVGTYDCYSNVVQDFGATTFQIQTTDYAGFVQDNWKVSPRLTLELGLRYDYESIPAPPANLTTATGVFVPYPNVTNRPQDKNNFGPRIGFAYDLYGDGNTVLRGGYGLYYGRILNGMILNAQFGSGSPNGQYQTAQIKPTAAGAPLFPAPVLAGAASTPSSFYMDSHLQNPQIHEFDLILQQQLTKSTVFSLTYLGALGRELPNFLDTNLAPPPTNCAAQSTSCVLVTVADSSGTSPLANGTQFLVPTFTSALGTAGYINPNFTNITGVYSNVNSAYHSMVAEIQNHAFHGLQFDVNYTWSHATDFNQNASSSTSTNLWFNPYTAARQNYGVSQFNVGNRVVAYALYQFPGLSGHGPLTYLTNGWTLTDSFQAQNGLPYSANLGSSTRNSTNALNSGSLNGVPGVAYVPIIGLNKFQGPRAIVDDVRLQKGFRIAERYDLQLLADFYNVANHENFSSSDINTTAYNFSNVTATSSTLTYVPRTSPYVGFQSHTTANDSGFLFTPREIQVGVRLEF